MMDGCVEDEEEEGEEEEEEEEEEGKISLPAITSRSKSRGKFSSILSLESLRPKSINEMMDLLYPCIFPAIN